MAFTLAEIVPWGRSFNEYVRMFSLTRTEFDQPILGCGDGPAGFNAEATRRGAKVVSCDPIYRFSAEEIRGRVEAVGPTMIDQLNRNRGDYRWKRFSSPEALVHYRLSVMEGFLEDYPAGLSQGRYVPAELPALSFRDGQFGLALCSYLLFAYSQHLSFEFHLSSILELCRVAREVRIFPVMAYDPRQPGHLEPVLSKLKEMGMQTEIQKVDYEFQRGANAFLRIQSPAI